VVNKTKKSAALSLKKSNKHRREGLYRLQSNEKLCKCRVLIHQKIIILQRISSKEGLFLLKPWQRGPIVADKSPKIESSENLYLRQ